MAETTTTDSLRELHVSHAPLVPWLEITHGEDMELQTFYNVVHERCHAKEVPDICKKRVCASSPNGWLVVDDLFSDEFFLFNPSSTEKIELPKLDMGYRICVLSSPPSDPNCRVLFVSESRDSIMFYSPADQQIGKEDQKTYRKQRFEGKTINHLTYCQGEAFCIVVGLRLVRVDFSSSVPELVEICRTPDDLSTLAVSANSKDFLVESCGELLLVSKYYHGLYHSQVCGFSVFRADLDGKTWVKLRNIGQRRAIFLDLEQGFSVSVAAADGEESSETVKGNSIYYFEPLDRCLYVFDMENEEIATFLPSSNFSRSNSIRSWVMMSSSS